MDPVVVPGLLIGGSIVAGLLGRVSRKACEASSVAFSFIAAGLSLFYLLAGYTGTCEILPPYMVFYTDGLALFMLAIVNGLGALIVLYSVGYMSHDRDYTRYYFLILLFIGAMSGLVLAGDIVLLYIFWEIVGICSALLIAYWWEKPAARRAGLKAFTVTRIGDLGMLFGTALIILNLHTTNIESVLNANIGPGLAYTIGLLLFIGAVGKSAQFPLYVWLPDAMEGPTSVSALIHAATMVKAGVYLISRFYPLISIAPGLGDLILWTALITVFISAFSALAADDIKRILAYSTINHLALMFTALALGGWVFAQLHLLSHSLFKALLFLCAGLIIHEVGSRKLDDMRGTWRAGLRITTIGLLVGSLSLAGLPPLPGYYTKDMVLSLFEEHLPNAVAMSLSAVIAFLSSLYIFRMFFWVAMGRPARTLRERDLYMLSSIAALTLGTLFGALLLGPASSLLGGDFSYLELHTVPLAASCAGLFTALVIWGFGYGEWLRKSFERFSLVAERGFFLDDLYTWFAVFVSRRVSRAVSRLQTGVPSLNVLWMIFFLVLLSLLILGVV